MGPRQQSCLLAWIQRLAGSGADEEEELLLTEDPVAWLRLKGLGCFALLLLGRRRPDEEAERR